MNIHVKVCYTSNKKTYSIHSSMSLGEMINQIKSNISRDFCYSDSQYELVEAGQSVPMRTKCEEGPVFCIRDELDNQTSICDRFDNHKDIAFYIRIITTPIQCIRANNTQLTTTCVICQESQHRLNCYYQCSHTLCNECYGGCASAYITRCAICRAEEV